MFKTGDKVRHINAPDLNLRVVRVQKDWFGDQILVVRDLDDGATFKVQAYEVQKVRQR